MATTKLNSAILRSKDLPMELTKLKPYAYKLDEKSDAVKEFELITREMGELFARKNKDYGNSFERSLDEDGPLVSKIRLGDKYSRFSALVKSPEEQQVKDESIRDTLIDMANYAVMTLMWLDKQKELEAMERMKELEKYMVDPKFVNSDHVIGTSVVYGNGLSLGGADFDGDSVKLYADQVEVVNEIREEENAK